MTTTLPAEVTAEQLAELFGCTPRYIRILAADGKIIRSGRGTFALAPSVQTMLAEAKKSSVSSSLAKKQEAFAAAKRRQIEMQNALMDHRLIELDEATSVVDEMVGILRAGIQGLPAQYTRDVGERRKLESLIDDLFGRVSVKFGERAAELKEYGEIDGTKKRAKRRKIR